MEKPSIRYFFAHVILPGYIFSDEKAFLNIVMEGREVFSEFLYHVWKHSKGEAEKQKSEHHSNIINIEEEMIPDFDIYFKTFANNEIMGVIKMPAPRVSPEASYVGFVFGQKSGIRYFTYELGTSLESDDDVYFVCEWSKDHSHMNYGSFNEDDPTIFTTRVEEIL
ncbi:MAG TPA: hypothetical protein VF941_03525 [Clostridia bacterium]